MSAKKPKNKKIFIIIGLIAIVAIAVGIYLYIRWSKVITFSREEITRAEVTNGNNGNVTKLTESEINQIYDDLTNTPANRVTHEESSGWDYNVVFYLDGSVESVSMIGQTWEVSGRYYEVSQSDGKKLLDYISGIEDSR